MNAQEKDRELFRLIATSAPAEYWRQFDNFGTEHARTLRRAQLTLHRWAELECGDGYRLIERDEKTGKPFCTNYAARTLHPARPYSIPDRERGALARVEQVCKAAGLYWYHQTDPRGCSLYVGAVPLTCQNYSTAGVACL